jgi:hypothetical protein
MAMRRRPSTDSSLSKCMGKQAPWPAAKVAGARQNPAHGASPRGQRCSMWGQQHVPQDPPSLNCALMACDTSLCCGRYTLSSVRSVESCCS